MIGVKIMSVKKINFPYYQLQRGENLKTLSKKFDVAPTQILLENNLSPKQIKEGIFVKITKN